MLVFQGEKLDEKVESEVHEFRDEIELGNEMAKFAAMNSRLYLQPDVRSIGTTRIQEPNIKQGLGPETCLVISEVVPAE